MTDLFTMMQGFQTTMQAVSARVEGQAQQLASLQAGDGVSVNSALTEGTGSLMDGYGNISRDLTGTARGASSTAATMSLLQHATEL